MHTSFWIIANAKREFSVIFDQPRTGAKSQGWKEHFFNIPTRGDTLLCNSPVESIENVFILHVFFSKLPCGYRLTSV